MYGDFRAAKEGAEEVIKNAKAKVRLGAGMVPWCPLSKARNSSKSVARSAAVFSLAASGLAMP